MDKEELEYGQYTVINKENVWAVGIALPNDKENTNISVTGNILRVAYSETENLEDCYIENDLSFSFKIPNDVNLATFRAKYVNGNLMIGAEKNNTSKNEFFIEIQ